MLAQPAEASKRLFAGIVDAAAERHGVDPDLVHAVIAVESGYRATAQSPAGAQGLMQLMPGTQRDLVVANAFDARQHVDAGVAYLRRLTDKFGAVLAIAAYNAGPGAVRRYNGIPPYAETRAYVRAVLDRSRPAVGAKATEEHDPFKDRALAVAEADVAEDAAPANHRPQDDHLAMDAAAGLQPWMLDAALYPDHRTRAAAPPDQLVIARDSQAGALGQGVADERPIQVGSAGPTHAAVTRFVRAQAVRAGKQFRRRQPAAEPPREPRSRSEPQFQDRLRGEWWPTRAGSVGSGQCARVLLSSAWSCSSASSRDAVAASMRSRIDSIRSAALVTSLAIRSSMRRICARFCCNSNRARSCAARSALRPSG